MSPARAAGTVDGGLTDRAAGPRRRRLALLLLPALVLAGTLGFDFVFDDDLVILADPLVTGPLDLPAIFSQGVRVADVPLPYYRPLVTLSYWVDHALWGENPAGYRLSNLLWYLGGVWLVFTAARRAGTGDEAAWAGALLFGLLPVHAEAVGWIQGRVDLISAACVLGALCLALAARRADAAGGDWRPWAAGLLLFLGLLAKESAAMLLLAWLPWEATGPAAGRRTRLAALAAGGLAYGVLRGLLVGGLPGFPLDMHPAALRIAALLGLLEEYARLLALPEPGLHFFRALRFAPDPAALLPGLAVLGLLLGGGWLAGRQARHLLPWIAWLPATLAPALLLAFSRPAPEVGFFLAERYLYLPSVGWCVLLGILLARAASPAGRLGAHPLSVGRVCLAGLAVGYAALLVVRLQPWADSTLLYPAMLAQPGLPASVRALAHNNLGRVRLERAEYAAARREFESALAEAPGHAAAQNNLGVLLLRQGRPAEARPRLEAAVRLDPNYADAYGNLGAALEALEDPGAARRAYARGLALAPGSRRLAEGLARVGGAERRGP
ncbi:MAG: tetratricopeptide repeat protein [Candidatus Methylomirabilota bacterium]